MRTLAIAIAAIAALAVPAAHAGGWATVTLAPPPAGLEAEETWTANLTVLRHGVTPTDGAAPSITIRGESGAQTFRAKPAGTVGKYVALVEFPTAGRWDYEVSDGLAATGYGVIADAHVLARHDRPGDGHRRQRRALWPFALAAIALAAAGALALVRQRGSRPATQS